MDQCQTRARNQELHLDSPRRSNSPGAPAILGALIGVGLEVEHPGHKLTSLWESGTADSGLASSATEPDCLWGDYKHCKYTA